MTLSEAYKQESAPTIIRAGEIMQDVADVLNKDARAGRVKYRSYGMLFNIIAVFASDAEANEFMAATPNASVIGSDGALVFIADKNDRGVKVTEPKEGNRK